MDRYLGKTHNIETLLTNYPLELCPEAAYALTDIVREIQWEDLANRYDHDAKAYNITFAELPRGVRTALLSVDL